MNTVNIRCIFKAKQNSHPQSGCCGHQGADGTAWGRAAVRSVQVCSAGSKEDARLCPTMLLTWTPSVSGL